MLVEPLLDAFAISCESEDGQSLEEKLDDLFHRFANPQEKDNDCSIINSILEYMLLQPGRIDDIVFSGENLLHIAAKKGLLNCISMLIRNGANPNPIDLRNGNTPLHFAAIGGYPECISLLLNGGTNPCIRNFSADKTALHYASEYGYDNCIEIILTFCEARSIDADIVSMRDLSGMTPLHLAAIDGNIAAVKVLLTHHANAAVEDHQGRNAYDIVKLLPGREVVARELKKTLPRGHRSLARNIPSAAPSISSHPTSGGGGGGVGGLFAGMSLASTSASLFEGLDLKPALGGTDLEAVPQGRWVVYQGKLFIADRASGRVIVHRDR